MSDLSDMLQDAMKDPRFEGILSTLKEKADSGELDISSIVSNLSGNVQADTGNENDPASPAVPVKPGMDNHKKLLAALKPYLRDQKKEAVDGILKIGEFSGVIEALTKKRDGGR